ncbi:MAG: hypothetical protein PWQ67_852 [Clostridia bacterium]|jgi:hypothetical protein|nr:hypothetical protein [Clostridia bacterium]MDN5322398.1 hypothetical protein [Clostridia bacterium]
MPVGDNVVLNGYTITLANIDNSNCPNSQTWTYTVVRTATLENAIRFWSLGLEHEPPFIILDTDNMTNIGMADVDFSDPVCLDSLPPTRPVIKWDIPQPTDLFVTGTFSFTLQGCFGEQQRDVALNAGGTCFFGQITGPSCQPLTTTTTNNGTTTTTTSTTTTTTTTTTTSTTTTTTTTTRPVRGVAIF